VAIVGPTGSGKTTLVDIILGLLPPQQGRLLVDDTEVRDDNLRNWQRNLGYVPQQIYLTDDTITRNIAFGLKDDEIDLGALEEAARIANLHDFIFNELPWGYKTIIGERGVRLSGGQRQRVGIARALYHNPEILVLDEATSSLDGVTEDAVLKALENAAQVKTLIIIAHRLTTVMDCDVIYLMDKGRIVASGAYGELVNSNAQFRALAKIKYQSDKVTR
jgi:ABC-type multidrug transport system fused ATPase/permease subunit